jgi:hypothetical protein
VRLTNMKMGEQMGEFIKNIVRTAFTGSMVVQYHNGELTPFGKKNNASKLSCRKPTTS